MSDLVSVRGEVLDAVVFTMRQEAGAWRLFPVGEGAVHDSKMLRHRGRVLGGRRDECLAAALWLEREYGFIFQRPPELQL